MTRVCEKFLVLRTPWRSFVQPLLLMRILLPCFLRRIEETKVLSLITLMSKLLYSKLHERKDKIFNAGIVRSQATLRPTITKRCKWSKRSIVLVLQLMVHQKRSMPLIKFMRLLPMSPSIEQQYIGSLLKIHPYSHSSLADMSLLLIPQDAIFPSTRHSPATRQGADLYPKMSQQAPHRLGQWA